MRLGHTSLVVAALILSLSTSGCGLIFGYGGKQPVQIITSPEGAQLIVDGVPWDGELSPTTVELHPKQDHSIVAKLPDGSSGQTHVNKELRIDVVVLDGFLTLGIGLLIDYMSGSLYKFRSPIHINLGKAPPPSPPSPPPVIPTSTTGTTATSAPCAICGEPRGDVTPCPHCGME